jgi:hypothetical protein
MRAHGDPSDRDANEFLDALDVALRRDREIAERTHASSVAPCNRQP